MRSGYLIAAGGGVAAVAAAIFAAHKSTAVKNAVLAATGGDPQAAKSASDKAKSAKTPADVQAAASQAQAAANAAPPSSPDVIAEADRAAAAAKSAKLDADVKAAGEKIQDVTAKMTGNSSIDLRLTRYWPLEAKSDAEKKMEGGTHDRKGRDLKFLEDAIAGTADFCSVSGDPSAFPYGQLLTINAFPGVKFRVVDVGQHFMGRTKIYRAEGREPLDIAVRARGDTIVPTLATGTIIRGDHFDKEGKDIVVTKFKGQTIVGENLHMLGAV